MVVFLMNVYSVLYCNEFNWKKYSLEIEADIKIQEIKKINHWIISHLENYPFNYLDDKEILEKFNFYDFSGDGMHDIVYYGPSGSEQFITVFLQNMGDYYDESLSFYGCPVEIIQPVPNYPAIIKMREIGNEFDMVQSIQLFTPSFINNRLTYTVSSKLNYIEGTLFPERTSFVKRFSIENDNYNIRSAPEVNVNNVVAIVKSGTEGFGISSMKDESGREWWFVLIASNINIIQSEITTGINNDYDFHILGWISSRFVKTIE